jgi:hypothetical protein
MGANGSLAESESEAVFNGVRQSNRDESAAAMPNLFRHKISSHDNLEAMLRMINSGSGSCGSSRAVQLSNS